MRFDEKKYPHDIITFLHLEPLREFAVKIVLSRGGVSLLDFQPHEVMHFTDDIRRRKKNFIHESIALSPNFA